MRKITLCFEAVNKQKRNRMVNFADHATNLIFSK